jgi:hypothetical protein
MGREVVIMATAFTATLTGSALRTIDDRLLGLLRRLKKCMSRSITPAQLTFP